MAGDGSRSSSWVVLLIVLWYGDLALPACPCVPFDSRSRPFGSGSNLLPARTFPEVRLLFLRLLVLGRHHGPHVLQPAHQRSKRLLPPLKRLLDAVLLLQTPAELFSSLGDLGLERRAVADCEDLSGEDVVLELSSTGVFGLDELCTTFDDVPLEIGLVKL